MRMAGMLFRCFDCPAAFSDEYLHDGFEPLDTSHAFYSLNYQAPTSAEYIRFATCAACFCWLNSHSIDAQRILTYADVC